MSVIIPDNVLVLRDAFTAVAMLYRSELNETKSLISDEKYNQLKEVASRLALIDLDEVESSTPIDVDALSILSDIAKEQSKSLNKRFFAEEIKLLESLFIN